MTIDFCEVSVDLAGEQQVVEVLFLASFLKRENALHDYEQDYAHREQIDLSAFISFAFFNLRCHVSHGTSVRLQTVDALVAGESEIGDLKIQLVVDENVF